MASILGLDLGEKRVGLAISDELEILATPFSVVRFKNRAELLLEIEKVVQEYRIGKIVVGLPKTLKGEIGPAARKTIEEVECMKARLPEVEWVFWDERLSTAEVERVLLDADLSRSRRKEVRDKLAAQRILQNYLDAQKNRSH